MLNYIKSEIYKLNQKTSYWIWNLVFLVAPAFIIYTLNGKVSGNTILAYTPVGIFTLFTILPILLTGFTFREDYKLNIFKNETTNGESRTTLFLSKFFSMILVETILYLFSLIFATIVCSYVLKFGNFEMCISKIFGMQTFAYLFLIYFYTALFQTMSVIIKRTSLTILAIVILNMAFTKVERIVPNILPVFEIPETGLEMTRNSFLVTSGFNILFIIIVLGIGITIFKKKEL